MAISIHALLEEGDQPPQFLSTPSARRATGAAGTPLRSEYHFYPRPPRGGRRSRRVAGSDCKGISIHALREEGDLEKVGEVDTYEISIHALREEGDDTALSPPASPMIFLSTPSARRATFLHSGTFFPCRFLSTPSARRATWRCTSC